MTAPENLIPFIPILFSGESTVVAEFVPESRRAADAGYQSEAALEKAFIEQLKNQCYEYLAVCSEADLTTNLRRQLERLNGISFSAQEWDRFFRECISGANSGALEKTKRIQNDSVQVLKRDDGSSKNIKLIEKRNIHENHLQVINQYEADGTYKNIYDVTILVNGLPLVHIELKRRGVDIREAFNQIERYGRDSFWAASGLFEYVQLFVISNGTLTKYYSNSVRKTHLEGKANSFAFTNWWADAKNQRIEDLLSFTKTFFSKHSLLNVLIRYCVLDVDNHLLVLRPYQIAAVERILQKVEISINNRSQGTVEAGGFVWHTTGSGKTLTSFKASQLLRGTPSIKKVLFVVDRKDLDYQTMREYDRFEKGAASANTSTSALLTQMKSPDATLIITTIQKLDILVKRHKGLAVYTDPVVIIFDECHRTQFGDMHAEITKAFKNYYLFGFTGTPIFVDNIGTANRPTQRTTEQVFGEKLHTYSIVDAIHDGNVLPFRIDYIQTIVQGASIQDKAVQAIASEEALLAPERISKIVEYVLEHFDQKTKRSTGYSYNGARKQGFNSLFACASVDAAKRYYAEFKEQQKNLPDTRRLKIGLIYSFAANEGDPNAFSADEDFSTDHLDQSSRDFLESAIDDYNQQFNTSFNTSGDGFDGYYKDVSQRLKDRELDILIVVNMFLTGFDAPTLNTLWLDKNLKAHGLLQAYSRTNRILNSVKAFGNIVSFRNLEKQTNEALALFGNKDAKGIVLLKPFIEYFEEYKDKAQTLQESFPLGQQPRGERLQKEFVRQFGGILRLRNILKAFDDFEGSDRGLLSERDLQDYQSLYLNLHADFRDRGKSEKESIADDVVFEIELVKQVEVNVDYILCLVEKFLAKETRGASTRLPKDIERAIDSSPSLRSKKDLIEQFIKSVTPSGEGPQIGARWAEFVKEARKIELDRIIQEEQIDPEKTREFMDAAFKEGAVRETGTEITGMLPKSRSRFSKKSDGSSSYGEKKKVVLAKLKQFFDRYFDAS